MISRRQFLSAGSIAAATGVIGNARSEARNVIDVKALGASGSGKSSDLDYVKAAVEKAARYKGGATVYFPRGEYYLGTASDSLLVGLTRLRDVSLVGEGATISCRSLTGSSSMLYLGGCRDIKVQGLAFRDYGLKREINWLGAAAIRIANDGTTSCENVEIKDCTFDSVLSAVVCRSFDGAAACRGITLSNLSVTRSYYGFSFQDTGNDVVARALRCRDVKRSYFPFGVSNHDIELDTGDNATGFTDVLIKCYHNDTSSIKARVKCRGKRGGDAIVALDHQHELGRGVMRDIQIELDVDDVDCRLDTVVLIRSFDPQARVEHETGNRWDNIAFEGDVRICDRTKLLDIVSVNRTPGRLAIGPRLARNPRLPKTYPGFVLSPLK
ncbi:MAG: twin-arginine translocation signal domain-containing protein [Burkholderiales bacterium]